jgi:3-oxoacyl-(acyl-carrier-protein) synthase
MLANKPNEARIVITGVSDSILPDKERQTQCKKLGLDKAGISPEDIDISSTHGIGSAEGDAVECEQLSSVSILAPI